jgi:hypothetical protein
MVCVAYDPPTAATEGVVWILKVEPKQEVKPDESVKMFELRRTYIFQPFHIDRRIAAQAGWFSIHWYSEGPKKFFSLDRIRTFKNIFKAMQFPKSISIGLEKNFAFLESLKQPCFLTYRVSALNSGRKFMLVSTNASYLVRS